VQRKDDSENLSPELTFCPQNVRKTVGGWGFTPDPPGELTALPRPPSWLKGIGGEEKGREDRKRVRGGKGRGMEERGRKREGRERIERSHCSCFTKRPLDSTSLGCIHPM
jgi:hypothetical protein